MMVIMKGAVVMFIDISDIKKSYGAGESRVEVLKGISFGVEKGEFCVLLGPSGSGKSTLLNIIGGIDDADSGYISINGEKIENMKEKAQEIAAGRAFFDDNTYETFKPEN